MDGEGAEETQGPEAIDTAKALRRERRRLRHARARALMQDIVSKLGPGDVVLDCGANVGDITVPLARTGALVYAFEPDPFAFGQISRKVARMRNVTLCNAAVGTTSGSIRLMRAVNFDANPRGGSVKSTVISGGRNIDEAAGIDVDLIGLPDFIRTLLKTHDRIAFVKMDIEGAELDLLEAMLEQDLFEHIGLTVAETHEKKFPDLRPRFRALRRAIGDRYPIDRVNLDWI